MLPSRRRRTSATAVSVSLHTAAAPSEPTNAYSDQGRLAKAEELQVAVLAARVRVLGEKHPDTRRTTRGLADTRKKQGEEGDNHAPTV